MGLSSDSTAPTSVCIPACAGMSGFQPDPCREHHRCLTGRAVGRPVLFLQHQRAFLADRGREFLRDSRQRPWQGGMHLGGSFEAQIDARTRPFSGTVRSQERAYFATALAMTNSRTAGSTETSSFGALAPGHFDRAVIALTGRLPDNWSGDL